MDTSNSTLPPLYATIKRLTNDESHRLDEIFPRRNVGVCAICHDEKTFRWYRFGSRSPDDVVTYDCPCADQFFLSRRLLASGVYESFQKMGWADFADQSTEAIVISQDYLKNARRFVDAGMGLIFSGDRGNGKTLLSNLIIKNLIKQGFDCYANTFQTMIDTLADGWTSDKDKAWFVAKVRNADVLLIDDLGRERNKGAGSLGQQALEEVVRHRVARSLPTLITTNETMDQIKGGYGGNTLSLLRGCSIDYQFAGSDWRKQMNVRTRQEMLDGLTRPVVID